MLLIVAALEAIIRNHRIGSIYHLVSILSATGEKNPALAWRVNIESLRNVLDLAVQHKMEKVFWPSSIAAFGPHTPRIHTHQLTVMDPNTMYGITKVTGELLCNYYFVKYGLDVRCLRYPGIISWKTPPGGGTTDYAVAIFHGALREGRYQCFVSADTVMPMMYMPDAIRAAIEFMAAPRSRLRTHLGYNLAAMSFSAGELAKEVKRHLPEFVCTYKPDERQKIADSWPKSIDDRCSRRDWGWKPQYNLRRTVADMLEPSPAPRPWFQLDPKSQVRPKEGRTWAPPRAELCQVSISEDSFPPIFTWAVDIQPLLGSNDRR